MNKNSQYNYIQENLVLFIKNPIPISKTEYVVKSAFQFLGQSNEPPQYHNRTLIRGHSFLLFYSIPYVRCSQLMADVCNKVCMCVCVCAALMAGAMCDDG